MSSLQLFMDLCKVREYNTLPALACRNRVCRVCAVATGLLFFFNFVSGLLNLKAMILDRRWALTDMNLKNTCFLNTSGILQQQIASDIIILHVRFI